MNGSMRRCVAVLSGAVLAGLILAACGNAKSGSGSSGGGASASAKGAKIAFLMPDEASPRYQLYDHPLFVKKMRSLCPSCKVLYQDANGDQTTQQNQMQSVIAQGAKVIVVDPVDGAALASTVNQAMSRGIKVIGYDRPFASIHTSFYVGFDAIEVGRLIGSSLVSHLKATGQLHTGGILVVNGSPTDPAAALYKKGIHEGLSGSGVKILAEYSTPAWAPSAAQNWVSGQISRFHSQIKGVAAANDGTGGGAIAAFKSANVNPVPPVTGQDATIAGLQLIVAGEQYDTINKVYSLEANAAAEAADKLLTGKQPAQSSVVYGTPAQQFPAHVVTRQNLKAQMITSGLRPLKQICTPTYAKACKAAGL